MASSALDRETSRPILATTDFSTNAQRGLRWAATLAMARQAPLQVIHATLESGSFGDYLGLADDTLAKLEAQAATRLEEELNDWRAAGIPCDWRMERGTPSEVIVEVAAGLGAQLIVIGTRGRQGLAHFVLGSTAERVAQRAACPVLSVHPTGHAPQWPPRNPLIATDFSPESEAALAALLRLWGDSPPATLRFLHTCHIPYDLGSENPCAPVASGSKLRQSIAGDVEERLTEFAAGAVRRGFIAESIFCPGHPGELILRTAGEISADLIVMGTRGRSGLAHVLLGSTAQRVIQRADCPVLTAPIPAG